MNPNLLLSVFPGIDLLGAAAEELGFTVVRGPDVLWGGDVRRFHPPSGVFGGIIGGPPCQCFSSLVHIVRHNGHEPRFGNLIPEFERVVAEAQPLWFLMENVTRSPEPRVDGYGVHSFCIDNHQFAGQTQGRKRRISFGLRGGYRVLPVEVIALESPIREPTATGALSPTSISNGRDRRRPRKGGGFRTGTAVLGTATRSQAVFRDLCRKQGLPADFDLPGMKIEAKCQAVGNGVPMAMGRALFQAIREVLDTETSQLMDEVP